MAATNKTVIKIYGSNTASAVPSAANLANDSDGVELAVNTADKRLFVKNGSGSVVELGTNPSALAIPASGVTGTLTVSNGGTGVTTLTGLVKGNGAGAFSAATAGTDYPGLATTNSFTAPQRGTVTTDNDLSFDLNATNYFDCTPTAGGALTFTNIAAAQSGHILLTNNSNYLITAAATTKINAADLTTISATGVYLLAYFSNGTNVYVVVSRSFA